MKAILLAINLVSWNILNAQLDSYSNDSISNGTLVWENVFTRDGSVDSLKKIVIENLKLDNAFIVLSESSDEILSSMTEKIFMLKGDKYSGRVLCQFKDGRFKVRVSSIRRFFGIKTMTMASTFGVKNEVQNMNGVTWEEDFTKNGTIKKSSSKGLDNLNMFFLKQFDYKPLKEKEW